MYGRCFQRAIYCSSLLIGATFLASHAEALTPLSVFASVSKGATSSPGNAGGTGAICLVGPPCGTYSSLAQASGVGGGAAYATVTLSGVPSGLAGQNGIPVNAQADVYYGIQLSGTAGVTVPVYISSLLSALSVSGYLSNQATLTVTSQVYGTAYTKTCYNGYCADSAPPFSGGTVTGGGSSGPAYLVSGYEYLVHLQATAFAGDNGTAEAFADPTYTVDPNFASRFQLIGVPGVVSSAVPEPAGWALMLAGFAIVGSVMRSRNQAVRAPG